MKFNILERMTLCANCPHCKEVIENPQLYGRWKEEDLKEPKKVLIDNPEEVREVMRRCKYPEDIIEKTIKKGYLTVEQFGEQSKDTEITKRERTPLENLALMEDMRLHRYGQWKKKDTEIEEPINFCMCGCVDGVPCRICDNSYQIRFKKKLIEGKDYSMKYWDIIRKGECWHCGKPVQYNFCGKECGDKYWQEVEFIWYSEFTDSYISTLLYPNRWIIVDTKATAEELFIGTGIIAEVEVS